MNELDDPEQTEWPQAMPTPAFVRRPTTLEGQFRQTLGEMECLTYGSVRNYSPSGHGSDEGGGRPPGDSWPSHLMWRDRWENGDEDKADLVKWAAADLEQWRKRTAPAAIHVETVDELAKRIIKDGRGFPVKEVAINMRTSETVVRKARIAAKVSPLDGAGGVNLASLQTRDDRRARAAELREKRLSYKQIGFILGVNAETIRRDLSDAA